MRRWLIESLTRLAGALIGNRRIRISDRAGDVRVNLGSGLRVAAGWINLDGSLNALVATLPIWVKRLFYAHSGAREYYSRDQYLSVLANHRFCFRDLRRGIPLPDSSANCVYSCHFLEHLSKRDGGQLIVEVFRILRPGGLVRLVVPDLATVIGMYATGERDRMLGEFFFVDRDASELARHGYLYDFDALRTLLADAGFAEINRVDFRQGLMPDLEILDDQPAVSLFVEARKPAPLAEPA